MTEYAGQRDDSSNRSFGLDILRASAIVGVLLGHEITMTGIPIVGDLGSGVDLFFVLSGFLIGRIYFRDSRKPSFTLRRFWMSRWWRTLPPYAAALLLYTIVRHTTASLAPPPPPLPWYYGVFLQNYLGITGFGPSWSLCVEEHFYLALPLIGWAIARGLGRRSFRYVLPFCFFIPFILRYLTMLCGFPPMWFFRTHLHCEGLIAGVYLAYLAIDEPATMIRVQKLAPWFSLLVPVTLFVAPIYHAMWFQLIAYDLLAISFAACVCCLKDFGWSPGTRSGRAVRWAVQLIALSAYSLYLVHTIVDPVFRGVAANVLHMHRGATRTLFVFAGILVVGELFAYFIERPTILWRNRLMHHAPEQTLPSPVGPSAV